MFEFHGSPKLGSLPWHGLVPSIDWLNLASVNIPTPNEAGVTVCVRLPYGCNKYPSDKSHIASLVLGDLTICNHAIKSHFFVFDTDNALPDFLPRRLFRG
jgi:hypothetical protein